MHSPFMTRPSKLAQPAIDTWIAMHSGWASVHENALAKSFELPDFASALALVVRVGLAAEKRDHHPDVQLGFGRATFTWSTHDAGGVTQLDIDLAELTEAYASALAAPV